MHIGTLAKETGLTPDAIRIYERKGLLPRVPRTSGGFRQFAESDAESLRFIRQAQGLGFTLKEMRELLDLRRSPLQPCKPVRVRLERKLSDVRHKLAGLQRLERELRVALRACNRSSGKPSARCPLLSKASGAQKRDSA